MGSNSSIRSNETPERNYINQKEFASVCNAVRDGQPVLVLAEVGAGSDEFALALSEQFQGEFDCAIATYKGSGKAFFKSLAEQLGVPTENDDGKPLTMEGLKEAIASSASDNWLLILPEAKRLTTGIRYWLEDLIAAGVKVVAFAVTNPARDIFLDMIEVELELPGDRMIREEMRKEAQKLGLQIDDSRLSQLQPLAGRNPQLARKVIRRERLGLNKEEPEHAQYLDISPIVMAALAGLGIVRFIGLGTGDRSLYIIGGIAMMAGIMLKYLGRVRGSRKKYGQ